MAANIKNKIINLEDLYSKLKTQSSQALCPQHISVNPKILQEASSVLYV